MNDVVVMVVVYAINKMCTGKRLRKKDKTKKKLETFQLASRNCEERTRADKTTQNEAQILGYRGEVLLGMYVCLSGKERVWMCLTTSH